MNKIVIRTSYKCTIIITYDGEITCYEHYRKITKNDVRCLNACVAMVNKDLTIREAAKKFNVSKSSLHLKIHDLVRFACPELYKDVKNQIKLNIKKRGKRRG